MFGSRTKSLLALALTLFAALAYADGTISGLNLKDGTTPLTKAVTQAANSLVGNSSSTAAASPAEVSSATALQMLRSNAALPFVLVCSGQSNAKGSDADGDKTIQSGIKILNGSNVIITAAFGTNPLNSVPAGGTSTNPALVTNNMCVHMANKIRLSGMIPSARDILIIPNWFPGDSIGDWMASGSSSAHFASLTASLTAAGVTAIDEFLWDQGEADYNLTAYSTQTAYGIAFSTFVSQLTALSQWTSYTTMTVQELAIFDLPSAPSRNDFLRTLALIQPWPLTSLVSSAGILPSTTATPTPHFIGTGLVELGRRHFQAWAAMSLGLPSNQPVPRSSDGFARTNGQHLVCVSGTCSFANNGKVVTGSPVNLCEDELRSGATIDATSTNFHLCRASVNTTTAIDYNVSIFYLHGGTSAIDSNTSIQTDDDSATTVTLSRVGVYLLVQQNGHWLLTMIWPDRYVGNLIATGKSTFGTAETILINGFQDNVSVSQNLGIGRATNDTTSGTLDFIKSMATTWAGAFQSGTAVASGTNLGLIRFFGDDGQTAGGLLAGQISCLVNGTVTAGVAVPGACRFFTTNTSGVSTQAILIDNAQGVTMQAKTIMAAQEIHTGIVTSTANITLANATRHQRCDKATSMTATLSASGRVVGQLIDIKNINVGGCTVDAGSGNTIDGAQTYGPLTQYQHVGLQCTTLSGSTCSAWDVIDN